MSKNLVRLLLVTFFVVSILVVAVACSKTSEEDKGANDANGQVATGKTIELLTFFNPDGTGGREKGLKQIIDNFTAETGIEIKYTTVPWNEVNTQLILSEEAGNSPDLSFVEGQAFGRHIGAGTLQPLDAYIARDLTDEDIADHLFWDFGVHEGEKFIFPISILSQSMFIRKDLLEDSGLDAPKTWDEFVDVAKALNTPSVAGFLFQGSTKQATQLSWLQLLIENRGGQILDENGIAVFDSQAGIDTFSFLRKAIHEHKITPLDAGSMSKDEITDAFAAGRVAMIIEGSHRYNTVTSTLGEDKLLLAHIPGIDASKSSPTTVAGWTLGIPKGSKNPDEAWEFIKYFNTTQNGLLYAKSSGEIPVLKSVGDDPYFELPEQAVTKFFVDYVNDNGVSLVSPETSAELNDILAEAIQRVILEENPDIKMILENAVEKYNMIVQ